ERHAEQNEHAGDADAELERGVDAQRMLIGGDEPRQQQAAETHAAHEGAEQDAERDRRRSDDELKELEPDDLVDQRRAAAADEKEKQRGKMTTWGHRLRRSVLQRRRGDGRVMADG